MVEKIGHIKNPLTIIAIFAGIAEISGTLILPFIDISIQAVYVWFLIIFPLLLISLFFITLNFNHKVLYAPSDYKNESNFLQSLPKATFADKERNAEEELGAFISDGAPSPPVIDEGNDLSRSKCDVNEHQESEKPRASASNKEITEHGRQKSDDTPSFIRRASGESENKNEGGASTVGTIRNECDSGDENNSGKRGGVTASDGVKINQSLSRYFESMLRNIEGQAISSNAEKRSKLSYFYMKAEDKALRLIGSEYSNGIQRDVKISALGRNFIIDGIVDEKGITTIIEFKMLSSSTSFPLLIKNLIDKFDQSYNFLSKDNANAFRVVFAIGVDDTVRKEDLDFLKRKLMLLTKSSPYQLEVKSYDIKDLIDFDE